MKIEPETGWRLEELLDDEEHLLMGVGPINPHPDVLAAQHLIDHLGTPVNHIIHGIRRMAKYAFQTNTRYIIGTSSSGSGAMQMAVGSMVRRGDNVLACVSGLFSERMSIIAAQAGGQISEVKVASGEEITAEMVEKKIDAHPREHFDVLTIVHGETSTGVVNSQLKEILAIANRNHIFTVVDTIATLTSIPFHMDNWRANVAFTAGQKGLSSLPGLSLVAFHTRAWDRIQDRVQKNKPLEDWYFNPLLAARYWLGGGYHYTASTPTMCALHKALELINKEGLEKRWQRHGQSSLALQTGLSHMGLELFVEDEDKRLPTAIAFYTPDGTSGEEILKQLREKHGVVIAGSVYKNLPILRIGQLGSQACQEKVVQALRALHATLAELEDKERPDPTEVAGRVFTTNSAECCF